MLVAVRPGAGYRDGGAPSNTRLNANRLAGLRRAQVVTPTLLALTTGPRSRSLTSRGRSRVEAAASTRRQASGSVLAPPPGRGSFRCRGYGLDYEGHASRAGRRRPPRSRSQHRARECDRVARDLLSAVAAAGVAPDCPSENRRYLRCVRATTDGAVESVRNDCGLWPDQWFASWGRVQRGWGPCCRRAMRSARALIYGWSRPTGSFATGRCTATRCSAPLASAASR